MIIVLRLYPSVPINSRSAIKTTTLPVGGGPDGKAPVLVPAGTPVGYCVYVMHRRKDLYGEDAEEFRPERWEGDELKDMVLGLSSLSPEDSYYIYKKFYQAQYSDRPLPQDVFHDLIEHQHESRFCQVSIDSFGNVTERE